MFSDMVLAFVEQGFSGCVGNGFGCPATVAQLDIARVDNCLRLLVEKVATVDLDTDSVIGGKIECRRGTRCRNWSGGR